MEENQENNKYRRISKTTAGFLVIVAVFYDLMEVGVDWIPAVGQILAFFIDLFALMHFTFWFKLKGLKMGSPKKIARYWLPMLLELLPIPLIDFFLTTLGVVLTIGITWSEDLTGLKVPNKKKALGSKIKKK